MNPEIIKEAERLIEVHKEFAQHGGKEENDRLQNHNATQAAIISATTARDSHPEWRRSLREENVMLHPEKWELYNDVILHLQSKLK